MFRKNIDDLPVFGSLAGMINLSTDQDGYNIVDTNFLG